MMHHSTNKKRPSHEGLLSFRACSITSKILPLVSVFSTSSTPPIHINSLFFGRALVIAIRMSVVTTPSNIMCFVIFYDKWGQFCS